MKAILASFLLLTSISASAQVPPETREEALTNCDDLAQVTTAVPPASRPYEFARAVIASLWYANKGMYMKQIEAQKKGFRPAYGRVCR